jgi:hypothetical protein
MIALIYATSFSTLMAIWWTTLGFITNWPFIWWAAGVNSGMALLLALYIRHIASAAGKKQ